MKDINKIIDSLSPGEQNVMYNALQKRLNRGPEYTIRKNVLGYSIKPNDNMRILNRLLCVILLSKLLKWLV